MKYGSVCSGVEAATVAWHPLSWKPQFFSEIEKFPSAVLAHHYPDVPNHGDMTNFKEWPDDPIDLLVGGTPCQSFSVAGLRKGLADPRGNLMLTYLAIAERYRPRWLVWENVPGVLSSNGGRDFGTFLTALGQLGYGFSWRILDAQYFGVAQRRRRVFVVGYLGDWRRAAAVLFDRDSLRGDTPPSREAGQGLTADAGSGAASGSHWDGGDVHPSLNQSHNTGGIGASNQEIFSQRRAGLVPAPIAARMVAFAIQERAVSENPNAGPDGKGFRQDDTAYTLEARSTTQAVAFDTTQITSPKNFSNPKPGDPCHPLAAGAHPPAIAHPWAVRRLTPRECERLQGFPDDYTMIHYRNKPAADGPRYKAMGNSMAVPVMRWIGEQINKVETIQ